MVSLDVLKHNCPDNLLARGTLRRTFTLETGFLRFLQNVALPCSPSVGLGQAIVLHGSKQRPPQQALQLVFAVRPNQLGDGQVNSQPADRHCAKSESIALTAPRIGLERRARLQADPLLRFAPLEPEKRAQQVERHPARGLRPGRVFPQAKRALQFTDETDTLRHTWSSAAAPMRQQRSSTWARSKRANVVMKPWASSAPMVRATS